MLEPIGTSPQTLTHANTCTRAPAPDLLHGAVDALLQVLAHAVARHHAHDHVPAHGGGVHEAPRPDVRHAVVDHHLAGHARDLRMSQIRSDRMKMSSSPTLPLPKNTRPARATDRIGSGHRSGGGMPWRNKRTDSCDVGQGCMCCTWLVARWPGPAPQITAPRGQTQPPQPHSTQSTPKITHMDARPSCCLGP